MTFHARWTLYRNYICVVSVRYVQKVLNNNSRKQITYRNHLHYRPRLCVPSNDRKDDLPLPIYFAKHLNIGKCQKAHYISHSGLISKQISSIRFYIEISMKLLFSIQSYQIYCATLFSKDIYKNKNDEN